MAALARAALLSSRLNFATEVWPLLIDKDGFGGVWLGADYVPFERCIWTAGTRQPKAGEEAGTSFSAAGKAALPLVPPKRKKNSPVRLEEEEEPHEVLARKMANQKQTKLAFGKPPVTEEEEDEDDDDDELNMGFLTTTTDTKDKSRSKFSEIHASKPAGSGGGSSSSKAKVCRHERVRLSNP